jgi:hypothetical protein
VTIVQIQHPIVSFESWKAAFDRDPAGRERSGVRRYRIVRGVDDPNFVAIDLEFDDLQGAERFRSTMQAIWGSSQAGALLAGRPELRILEEVESHTYEAATLAS